MIEEVTRKCEAYGSKKRGLTRSDCTRILLAVRIIVLYAIKDPKQMFNL